MIEMRRARSEDAAAVFSLANDPIVRAVSFASDPIPFEEHLVWFERRIAEPGCLFLLFYDGAVLAGQIRFTLSGFDEAELSISVASDYRGKGLARGMMRQALDNMRETRFCKRVLAHVKPDTEASNRFFERCGFSPLPREVRDGKDCNAWVHEL